MEKNTLKISALSKAWRKRKVVDEVSLEAQSGEITCLLGPNGAGKTTTFYMICGLIQPDSGQIYFNDHNISNLPMHKRAQMGIGYLPQEASVFRGLSVLNNIKAVLELKSHNNKECTFKAEQFIEEFSLQHVRNTLGSELSGGERRRCEIARALAVDPLFILLDEPFAGVDPISIGDTKGLIKKVAQRNIGVIITDHNVRETLALSDVAFIMANGKLIASGTPDEIVNHQQVRKAYLGDDFNF